jgi:hypothetical protein
LGGPHRHCAAKLLMRDEARWIAANIAKLPESQKRIYLIVGLLARTQYFLDGLHKRQF